MLSIHVVAREVATKATQKDAYDIVLGTKAISEKEIRRWIHHYGKLLHVGKPRIMRLAGQLADQLITDVGVETYNINTAWLCT